MKLARLLRHVGTTRWRTRKHFPRGVLDAIEKAIGECEHRHAGEIRFVIETAFDLPELWRDLTPRTRALEVFGQFDVWDTEHNNGVLIYVLLADHDVEIVADRGIAQHVSAAEWAAVCRQMEGALPGRALPRGLDRGRRGRRRLARAALPRPAPQRQRTARSAGIAVDSRQSGTAPVSSLHRGAVAAGSSRGALSISRGCSLLLDPAEHRPSAPPAPPPGRHRRRRRRRIASRSTPTRTSSASCRRPRSARTTRCRTSPAASTSATRRWCARIRASIRGCRATAARWWYRRSSCCRTRRARAS